ncbi:MAG: hypothetical protein AAF639_24330 [Chloroflexota bacterium]
MIALLENIFPDIFIVSGIVLIATIAVWTIDEGHQQQHRAQMDKAEKEVDVCIAQLTKAKVKLDAVRASKPSRSWAKVVVAMMVIFLIALLLGNA